VSFFDAILHQVGWSPTTECVCGAAFHINHALCYKVGGLITLKHNEIRHVTAELLSRADVSMRGFWQRAFVDVRGFYPFAPHLLVNFQKWMYETKTAKLEKHDLNDMVFSSIKKITELQRTNDKYYV